MKDFFEKSRSKIWMVQKKCVPLRTFASQLRKTAPWLN